MVNNENTNTNLSMLQEQDLKKSFEFLAQYNLELSYEDFIKPENKNLRITILKSILTMDISKAEKTINISTFLRKQTIGDRLNFSNIDKYTNYLEDIYNLGDTPKESELNEVINGALNGLIATLVDLDKYSIDQKIEILENAYNLIQKI